MEIKSLEGIEKEQVYKAFTLAFENYVVPIQFNKENTLKRWEDAGIDFKLSFGAFDDGELVAFILQLPVGKTLHNFMTGVIPSHRGLKLIPTIYEEIRKHSAGYESYSLEVIKENIPALRLYQKLGFRVERELVSLKGFLKLGPVKTQNWSYDILPLSYTDEMKEISLANPSVEFSSAVVSMKGPLHELHTLHDGTKLCAYAIYQPRTLSLKEFGSLSPLSDNLGQLLAHMKLNHESLRIMNIDSRAENLISFLQSVGGEVFVRQFEMKRPI